MQPFLELFNFKNEPHKIERFEQFEYSRLTLMFLNSFSTALTQADFFLWIVSLTYFWTWSNFYWAYYLLVLTLLFLWLSSMDSMESTSSSKGQSIVSTIENDIVNDLTKEVWSLHKTVVEQQKQIDAVKDKQGNINDRLWARERYTRKKVY